MSETGFKDDFADLDDEAADLGASFSIQPMAETEEAKEAVEKVVKAADAVSEGQGFQAPKPRRASKKKGFRRSDNLRTGRNETISLKGKGEDKERLLNITEDRKWVNGQTFTYALDALLEKINNPEDEFWKTRNFHGVD